MGLFRKKLPQLENKRREYPRIPYKLVKSWDTEKARTHYKLYEERPYFGYPRTQWYWSLEATGDKAWADKTAKHFGIVIQEEQS